MNIDKSKKCRDARNGWLKHVLNKRQARVREANELKQLQGKRGDKSCSGEI